MTSGMHLDGDRCYAAMQSRDQRFDGWFFVAVNTTGIYCRPSCPATLPRRHNVSFYPTAAAAQVNGFRSCKRCRPDATPGSPEWNARHDLVGRAMRLIADGVVERDGVGGLATKLGYSERHLNRLLTDSVGAGPLALARAQRARAARVLIETTTMPITDVAFAAGFASVRQFNDVIREVFASTPSDLRKARRPRGAWSGPGPGPSSSFGSAETGSAGEALNLRLAHRSPYDADGIFGFLGLRAVPGVESFDGVTYRRSMRLPLSTATIAVTPADGHLACCLRLGDLRDLTSAVQRVRRLFDLDADPVAVGERLGVDELLGPLVRSAPGLRSPGAVDGFELAVRAVLGQQISVVGARTLAGRIVSDRGDALALADHRVSHLFPTPEQLAALDPATLAMPMARREALIGLCRAFAEGRVSADPGDEPTTVQANLVSLKGIGPWTAQYVAMRALGDPDIFMPADLGVRHALERLGVDGSPKAAAALSEQWRPWRSYALHHLWRTL